MLHHCSQEGSAKHVSCSVQSSRDVGSSSVHVSSEFDAEAPLNLKGAHTHDYGLVAPEELHFCSPSLKVPNKGENSAADAGAVVYGLYRRLPAQV
jgi:hypothetical protein